MKNLARANIQASDASTAPKRIVRSWFKSNVDARRGNDNPSIFKLDVGTIEKNRKEDGNPIYGDENYKSNPVRSILHALQLVEPDLVVS